MKALQQAYGSVDAIDLWTGGLAEKVVPGAFLGSTFQAIVADQFERLRDGDRLWYENQGFETRCRTSGIRASRTSSRATPTRMTCRMTSSSSPNGGPPGRNRSTQDCRN